MPQSIPSDPKTHPITSTPAARPSATGVSTPAEDTRSTRQPLRGQLGKGTPNSRSVEAVREFLTMKEVAADLRLGLSSVSRLVKQGMISAINVSSGNRATYRVPRGAFEEFKRSRTMITPKTISTRLPPLPPGVEQWV